MGILFFFSFIGPSAGQCSNTLGTRSYDTLITGPGYGSYTLSFPKWNPDSGTLMSVKLSAVVSQQYSFTLKNADVNPSIYTIQVGRFDQISSPAMSSAYTNTTQQNLGAFPLNPGASVSRAPFVFLSNYANTDSITGQVAPFAGTGNLSFVYAPITYTDVHTNNNSSYSYSALAGDSIHFSISYQYCTIGVLASSLIRFTALPRDASTVELDWTMANEEGGRSYVVEQSEDGLHFSSAGFLSSVAGGTGNVDYRYVWTVLAPSASVASGAPSSAGTGSPGKWYFRLKIISTDGRSGYSDIKIVTLGSVSGNGLRVYPDPTTDFVNIDFGSTDGNWQVDLFSADGRLVQRELYSQVHTVRLNFRQALARGTYFIRATEPQTHRNYNSSLLVR